MARPALFIFARAPAHGGVKTRLARDIGAAEALRFHRNQLSSLVRRFRACPRFEVILAVTPASRLHAAAWPAGVARVDQGRGDLGQRMLRTLRRAGRRPALLVGSDIPDVREDHLVDALRLLARSRQVLGPTEDGGYWLIGARSPWLLSERQLHGVRWSTPHALDDTLARLPDTRVMARVLADVDDGDSWSQFKARQRGNQSVKV
jgi:rSAM/selenodomain-associated transferase 1